MAISDIDDKALYNGNGVTVNFAIPHAIMVDDSSEVEVYKRNTLATPVTETLMVEGALQDYTLAGASPPTTPFDTTVVFNTAPLSTDQILVRRKLPLTQILDMADSQATPLTSIELALDRLVGMIQQLDERLDRSPQYPKTSDIEQPEIPEPTAGYLIGYNSAGDNLEKYSMDDIADALSLGALLTDNTISIANNQGVATSLTSMIFDKDNYKTVVIDYTIKRRTATQGLSATGRLILEYEEYSAGWTVTDINYTTGHGVTFTITGAGQVQYISDSMLGGSYLSGLTWRIARRWEADS